MATFNELFVFVLFRSLFQYSSKACHQSRQNSV